MDAVVRWTLARPGNDSVRSVNALVGETNDGTLNDIRGLHVTRDHVLAALNSATSGAVAEGAVGAGTGTIAFGFKGGIGTASRRVSQRRQVGAQPAEAWTWTVGVLVQTNYGGHLTMGGVDVGRDILPQGVVGGSTADGSCMIVVATDAPLDARDLKRLAARAVFALARTGSTYSNGSGDFAIAFSTDAANRVHVAAGGPQPRVVLSTDSVSPLFEAVLDATEEAVYNSLLQAVDTTGNGRTVRALPIEPLRQLLKKHGR
jgi:D-aminopeptidase